MYNFDTNVLIIFALFFVILVAKSIFFLLLLLNHAGLTSSRAPDLFLGSGEKLFEVFLTDNVVVARVFSLSMRD